MSAHLPELDLPEGVVHLWRIPLVETGATASLHELLSPDERDRAARFHFEKHRRRYVIGRGMLRSILARYVCKSPADLRFNYNPQGRPSLTEECHGVRIEFNLSHSEEMGLLAVVKDRMIGVDIEQLRPMEQTIAQRFFSDNENAELCLLQDDEWKRGFFNCWTRKEACLKAIGQGISAPLDKFDVSLTPGQPAKLLAARTPLWGDIRRWQLEHLHPAPGYVGAVAIASLENEFRWMTYK
jgi:4'-phosphopantetheinyl transferase